MVRNSRATVTNLFCRERSLLSGVVCTGCKCILMFPYVSLIS